MKIKKRDGKDYAWSILCDNARDARALLEKANNIEGPWLEYKGDPFCRKDHPNGGKLSGDEIWHTLKAVVSMVNTRGGCILFGVEDKTHKRIDSVYEASIDGNTFDFDAFHRKIIDEILRKTSITLTKDDKNGSSKSYELSHSIEPYCELKLVYLDGKPISILLVKESANSDYVWVKEKGRSTGKQLFVRSASDCGKTKVLDPEELLLHQRPKLDFDSDKIERHFDNMLAPVPEFIGREKIIDQIEQCFIDKSKWLIPLLYGPAGVGKSEIAYKFALERTFNYNTLVLIDCSQCKTFVDAIVKISENPDFRLAFLPDTRQEDVVALDGSTLLLRIREAIEKERLGKVLIVLDDVRNPDVIRPAIINRYLGRLNKDGINIIATTRYPLLTFLADELIVPIEVTPFNNNEGVLLLSKKRTIEDEVSRYCAEDIIRLVGGNPWAIDLVGEYLKQKCFKSADDFEKCKNDLSASIANFFPPKEHGVLSIGNATGVINVHKLLEHTVASLSQNERIICFLISLSEKHRGYEVAYRSAAEWWYKKTFEDDEWHFYIESLKKKCFISEDENEFGVKELYLRDCITADYFKSIALKDKRYKDAYLEYIRIFNQCRSSVTDSKFKYHFDFVMNGPFDIERKIEVIFDDHRFGWPLYFLGKDIRKILRMTDQMTKTDQETDYVEGIKKLGALNQKFLADITEIESICSNNNDRSRDTEILELRKSIYKDNPMMLCQSYLHAEGMGRGELNIDERKELLSSALECAERIEDNAELLSEVLYCFAVALDEERLDLEFQGEDSTEVRKEIRDYIRQAEEVYPERFSDVDDIEYYIEEGICP